MHPPTHPSIVVEESGGGDDGQEDDGGPHGALHGALRPVHHVVPPVQRRVHAERTERFTLAQPLLGQTRGQTEAMGRAKTQFGVGRCWFLSVGGRQETYHTAVPSS